VVRPGVTEAEVWAALKELTDPEIPTLTLVDLGVIRDVEVGERIVVRFTPTFLGCPAVDRMKREIEERLSAFGPVEVAIDHAHPWTPERLTETGKLMLSLAGFALPDDLGAEVAEEAPAACPHCGSRATTLINRFGPTACRALGYCNDCRQPFEIFKVV